MSLRAKFNVVLSLVFLVGFAVSATISFALLNRAARRQVLDNAGIMMASALAVRGYTVNEIRPLLEAGDHPDFLPQTVPAYAATTTFLELQDSYPEFTYKEATLNPTNPTNRAADWETDIIATFANDAELEEIVGERMNGNARSLYLARPIRLTNPECLACHGTPDEAPQNMIAKYGDANGFGWALGDVIGSQIVSVPMSVAISNANRLFLVFTGSLLAVFVVLFLALNVMLTSIVIRPVAEMAHAADQISLGNFQIAEFTAHGHDEVSQLRGAFNRMRRSLERALSMIGDA
jgi:protein-histidine pros-kinase